MTDPDPAEALASIRAARGAIDDRLKVHWLYDAVYGLLCGGVVASLGVPQPFGTFIVTGCILGLVVMVRWWRKETGLWISGVSPPRARWVAYGLGVVLLALVLGGLWLTRHGVWWGSLAAGGVAAVVGVLASRLWTRVYRRELAEGA